MPLALAATVAGAPPAAAQDAAGPDILLILGDYVGYGDLGLHLGGGDRRSDDGSKPRIPESSV